MVKTISDCKCQWKLKNKAAKKHKTLWTYKFISGESIWKTWLLALFNQNLEIFKDSFLYMCYTANFLWALLLIRSESCSQVFPILVRCEQ